MDSQAEKVYVAIGADPQEGFSTLEWTLRKWSSRSISIVILQAFRGSSTDYVYGPFGKLPSSSSYVSAETLEVLKRMKEVESEKLLSQYKAFCGKVKVEILKIEKYDEPLRKVLVELITGLQITKLVMGLSFMKSSSRKSRGAVVSGSFYVHHHKPENCELFIIYGGKLVFLREEDNERFIADDKGLVLSKFKERGCCFKDCLGIKLPDIVITEKNPVVSPSSSKNEDSPDQWENHVQEIESYFNQLSSSNSNEETSEVEETFWDSPAGSDMTEDMSDANKIEMLKVKIAKAHDMIKLKRKDAQINIGRQAKAEWAIWICTRQSEELEARLNEEIAARTDLTKDLDFAKEQVFEVQTEVEDKRRKLESTLELQSELSNKLQQSSLSRSQAEAQIEKAITTRAEMVREIGELRRQRDVLQRRIEFCKDKDALGMASRLTDLSFSYKEFTAEEIRSATDNFSERLRLKSAGDWTNVYRGRVNYTTLAIKMYNSGNGILFQEALRTKVEFLSHIRHPHLVAMLGFCSDLNCIVYEYMHNGSLRDALFSVPRSSQSIKRGFDWHARIRIAAQISSGLGFLHSAKPRPIAHGNLNPSKILLDSKLVAKIHGFRADCCNDLSALCSDIWDFGNLVMQLLSGRNWAGLVEEAMVMDGVAFVEALDVRAGEWPVDLAIELARIAMRCISANKGPNTDLLMATVVRQIDRVKKRADDILATRECDVWADIEESGNVPSAFLCPIFQDVMKNPQIAADGFSYELEAIEEWLRTGRNTSPVTNLRLNHKHLTPNHTMRSLIHDWHKKFQIPLP